VAQQRVGKIKFWSWDCISASAQAQFLESVLKTESNYLNITEAEISLEIVIGQRVGLHGLSRATVHFNDWHKAQCWISPLKVGELLIFLITAH
jgi:hypothetical protein